VNQAQVDGMTALHWAIYLDDLETVKLLVGAGADVNARNQYDVKPLSLACTNGNAAMVELLLKSGADFNTALRGGETVLMTAARTGRAQLCTPLLAAAVSPPTSNRAIEERTGYPSAGAGKPEP